MVGVGIHISVEPPGLRIPPDGFDTFFTIYVIELLHPLPEALITILYTPNCG